MTLLVPRGVPDPFIAGDPPNVWRIEANRLRRIGATSNAVTLEAATAQLERPLDTEADMASPSPKPPPKWVPARPHSAEAARREAPTSAESTVHVYGAPICP